MWVRPVGLLLVDRRATGEERDEAFHLAFASSTVRQSSLCVIGSNLRDNQHYTALQNYRQHSKRETHHAMDPSGEAAGPVSSGGKLGKPLGLGRLFGLGGAGSGELPP